MHGLANPKYWGTVYSCDLNTTFTAKSVTVSCISALIIYIKVQPVNTLTCIKGHFSFLHFLWQIRACGSCRGQCDTQCVSLVYTRRNKNLVKSWLIAFRRVRPIGKYSVAFIIFCNTDVNIMRKKETPSIFMEHTHITYTYHIHVSHTRITYTYHIHVSHTRITYTYHIHVSHTRITYTYHIYISHTRITYTYLNMQNVCTLHTVQATLDGPWYTYSNVKF
jgi:hypothetical protein